MVARLPAGEVPGADTCGRALDGQAAPTITALKAAEVVCVRTSRSAIAALTMSGLLAGGRVYYAYYAPKS